MGAALTILLSTLLAVNSGALTLFALKIIHGITKHQPVIPTTHLALESDMPSVTVCIPARNEEHALAECLQRIINSTYQKLEIIVLDDSSNDKTSLLIKSFAHAGVRFVRGSTPPSEWLGKNFALKQLAKEASGSYVLFIDVDTRLAPSSIEHMVRTLLANGSEMLSVLPRRSDPLRASVLWSPLKYYWELVRSRQGSEAVASNAWLIKRKKAMELFTAQEDALKSAVLPEGAMAHVLQQDYAYTISTKDLGVSYEKKLSSQRETSIRLLYPMLGSRTLTSLIACLGLAVLLVPYGLIAALPWTGFTILSGVALVIALGFCLLYAFYARTFWNNGAFIAFFIWPLIVLQEISLVIISLIQYKTNRVLWKGRPIRSTLRLYR